ncbi:MAG: hypothetical protein IH901_00665 [Proteobacteria bacterium]|nr:hypothetical protein [Pseudomonadota bacterium]
MATGVGAGAPLLHEIIASESKIKTEARAEMLKKVFRLKNFISTITPQHILKNRIMKNLEKSQ